MSGCVLCWGVYSRLCSLTVSIDVEFQQSLRFLLPFFAEFSSCHFIMLWLLFHHYDGSFARVFSHTSIILLALIPVLTTLMMKKWMRIIQRPCSVWDPFRDAEFHDLFPSHGNFISSISSAKDDELSPCCSQATLEYRTAGIWIYPPQLPETQI